MRRYRLLLVIGVSLAGTSATPAPAAEPITIGLGIAQSGQLAANGKAALAGMKIWQDDVNAKGGLLGRPVKLVYYDDQSNPANVPALYTKLLEIDKVDLIVSGYATNMIAAALPVAIQKKKLFIGLFGTGVNSEFHYPKYFSMNVNGPEPKRAVTAGLFDVAAAQTPKPQTVAIVAVDAEFGRNASDGARENAKAKGLKIVYDRTYPPSTTDFSPIVRAIAATNPDIVTVCSYPLDSVGILRTISEIGFEPKLLGGAMVGLQSSSLKVQLGPLLNGIVKRAISWRHGVSVQIPAARSCRGHRPARLQHASLGVRRSASPRRGDPRDQQHRRCHPCGIPPRECCSHNRWDYHVRARRRMGRVQDAASSVPQHSRERFGAVQGYG
jgi:branched-chain amino acid transport system substrate-binding protein